MSFSCYIIGDDNLSSICGKILLHNQCKILGIITSHSQVIQWAQLNKIPVIKSPQEFAEKVVKNKHKYDYLFSISNSKILSENILKSPVKLAINYHNAPLPKYGGVYATSWAIMHGEIKHGITWHVMTKQIDGGDILLQKIIPIEKEDTALTLNIKCHKEAGETFKILVNKILSQKTKLTPQSGIKSYFSFKHKPKNGAIISWKDSTQNIYNLYRALNMPNSFNRLGLPKVLIGKEFYIPRKIIKQTIKNLKSKPGYIVKLTKREITVATSDGLITLSDLLGVDGTKYSIKDLCNYANLKVGTQLPETPPQIIQHIIKYTSEHVIYETQMVRNLQLSAPVMLPYFKLAPPEQKKARKFSKIEEGDELSQSLKDNLLFKFKQDYDLKTVLLTITLIYIYKLNSYNAYTIDFCDTKTKEANLKTNRLLSTHIPLTINFDLHNKDFNSILELVKKKLISIKEIGSYQRDLFIRHPGLNSNIHSFPLAINIHEHFEIVPAKHALTIAIENTGNSIKFIFNKTDFISKNFEKASQKMFEQLTNMLNQVAKNPKVKISEITILSTTELQNIRKTIKKFEHSNLKYPHQLFEQQAQLKPKVVALTSGDYHLTYGELNAKANKMAHYFLNHNIKPNDVIAISLESSILFVITVLAIWKAGATYMPLDPTYPQKQLTFMLAETKPKILITRTHLASKFVTFDKKIVRLDQEALSIFASTKNKNPQIKILPSNTAYIIYTSGSTGKPKGVPVSFKCAAYSLTMRLNYYKKTTKIDHSKMVLLLLMSTSFDTSLAAIFWPLSLGGELVLLNQHQLNNHIKIAKAIAHYGVTHTLCVPAFYEKILNNAIDQKTKENYLKKMQLVIIGGDQCNKNIIKTHKTFAKKSYLVMEYGLTETSIQSTAKIVYDAASQQTSELTIGFPMDKHTAIMLFDQYGQLVPEGVMGNIHIYGPSVTDGYLKRPLDTTKRFVKIKIPEIGFIRFCQTGDLGCMTKEGILFKGRIDHQAKLRGFRIGLKRIEALILKCDNVNNCIVVLRSDKMHLEANKYLVAYIVPKELKHPIENSVDLRKIRQVLVANLPGYSIPNAFVVLDQLPLTKNKKIDRKALPIPKMQQRLLEITYIPPKDKLEKQLVLIWSDILKIDKIGIKDNFFDLGGNSILVTTLLNRIQNIFKKNFSMSVFFESPTIENLAEIIRKDKKLTLTSNSILPFTKDLKLDSSIKPSVDMKSPEKIKGVLLTGATGFLGVHLLEELCLNTEFTVYCLVRAKDIIKAHNKLRNTITNYRINSKILDSKRVIIVMGDLSKLKCGLSPHDYDMLSKKVDVIIHNGAYVHHLYNYEQLKATNVGSTRELLKLCVTFKLKELHFISTLSAIPPSTGEKSEFIPEDFVICKKSPKVPKGGYAQTKYVSEYLISQAKARGIPISIYRPSWILGHDETGISPIKDNHLLQLIKGCTQLKSAPDWKITLDILPVNIVSKCILLAVKTRQTGKVFNIHNRKTTQWLDLIKWMKPKCKIEIIKAEKWHTLHLSKVKEKNTLFPLLAIYKHKYKSKFQKLPEIKAKINDKNAHAIMQKIIKNYPDILKLFEVYFQYFYNTGFIQGEFNIPHINL